MRLTGLPPIALRLPSSRARTAPVRAYPPAPAATPKGLTEVQDFGANPGALRMFLHVPDSLPKASPLVVVLHGCGQTAGGYDHGAGWSALGDRLGFAVLAPEQQNSNNMAGCFNWFQPGDTTRGAGEAASIHQMIAKALADHRLDKKRVFITGLSAGGAMTAAMLAAYPEIFAGGAIIAGLPYGAASNVPEAMNAMRHAPQHSPREWAEAVRRASGHAGPWPMLSVWHGDADNTVHLSNADALLGQWAELHGLPAGPSQTEELHGHTRRSWQRADGTVPLESYTMTGVGHGTPIHAGTDGHAGTDKAGHAGAFFIETGLASTLEIAKFWSLQRPAPHIVAKQIVVKKLPVRAILSPVLGVAQSPPVAEQTAEDIAPPPPAPPKGLRAIIVKALETAGLVKKPDQ